MKVLTIYDKKAERYGNPFVTANLAVADRDFAMACKEPKSPMAMYPEDISLILIGDYNENTGILTPCQPQTIAEAKTYIKKEEKQKNG